MAHSQTKPFSYLPCMYAGGKFVLTNTGGHDQKPHYAVADLGIHCLCSPVLVFLKAI